MTSHIELEDRPGFTAVAVDYPWEILGTFYKTICYMTVIYYVDDQHVTNNTPTPYVYKTKTFCNLVKLLTGMDSLTISDESSLKAFAEAFVIYCKENKNQLRMNLEQAFIAQSIHLFLSVI